MSSKKSGQIPETEAERAFAEVAAAKFADYKARWVPVQKRLGDTVKAMGAPDSHEREALKGKFGIDTAIAFDQAADKVEDVNRNAGVDMGSSRFKLGQAKVDIDKQRSLGIGKTSADQMVDDAYVQGLQSLMAIGRGNEAAATSGMGASAGIASRIAANDAAASAANRAGNMGAAGTLAGIGAGMYANRKSPGGIQVGGLSSAGQGDLMGQPIG